MDYQDRTDRYNRAEASFSRFVKWLKRRPAESWGFFIAGILIAGLLF
jgi:hypothetical protein